MCAPCDFFLRCGFVPRRWRTLVPARSPVSPDPPPTDRPVACELPRVWHDWHSLSVSLSRTATRGPDHIEEPVLPLPPAHAECVCSASWKVVCAPSCCEMSPISSAHVSAVIRPTQGTVCSRRTLSARSGSRCSERINADSMCRSRRIESWLTRRSGRILSMTSLPASSSETNPSRWRSCLL